ncbi:alpha/beta hydrolase [Virgibacillus kekensis]|uniref:Alpha/beta hydrolase n=1 Tax=Virgibacillus kekensis TaxID=202261 RepID=A0ABV9DF60_9BACI
MEETKWLKMQDDTEIYLKKWSNTSKKPKAIVQIAHGMVEHIERYNGFAKYLIEKDIFVYGNDHRGHGKTGEKQGLFGYFADEDGFEKATGDLLEVTNHIRQEYPDTPLILLGHSMGSFLARNYIQQESSIIDGVILSGTGYYPVTQTRAGKKLSSTLSPKEKSTLMNTVTFFSYNKRVKNKKTNLDWLSRDETVVLNFIEDPYCGFIPTAQFFYDLMDGLLKIHDKESIKSIRADLSMLIFSGDEDPVGDYEKGIWKTAHLFADAGMTNIMTLLYEGGRHEMLNEINRKEVYRDVYSWIAEQI